MLTITKLGIGTAREYFQKEFANASNSYFSEQGVIQGRWSGSLAQDLGLGGGVSEEAYLRLAAQSAQATSDSEFGLGVSATVNLGRS